MRERPLIVAGTVNARPLIDTAPRFTIDDFEAILVRPAWHADAACREHPELDFFPEQGQSSEPAKAVCAGCLVRGECRAAAVAGGEQHGIWGGLSARQRRLGVIDPPPPRERVEPRPKIRAERKRAPSAEPGDPTRLACPLCGSTAATDNSLAGHIAHHHGLRGAGRVVRAERRRLVALAVEELARRAA